MIQHFPLENVTVAITEHRFTREFATLFEKLGAKVHACPLLQEAPVENRAELQEFVRRVTAKEELDAIIFFTGVGVKLLVAEAESIGLRDEFLAALEALTVIARSPKPISALRQFGVGVDITPDKPTTEGLIETLATRDLRGLRIGVQLYGTPNPQIISALEAKGVTTFPIQVYNYASASGRESVQELIFKAVAGQIDVLTFTSAPQVRTLFDIAASLQLDHALQKSLNNGIAVASVGEVTTRELESHGVKPKIVPQQPKMGPMVLAVADFFQKRAT